MKQYDDEDDELEQDDLELAPADKLTWIDIVLAAVVGVGVYAILAKWAFSSLHPMAWSSVADTLRLHPICNVLSGVWCGATAWIVKGSSVSSSVSLLQTLGHVFVAASASVVFLFIREICALVLRIREFRSRQRTAVARFSAFFGALLFACADPVWMLGQVFIADTFFLFLAVLSIALFFDFFIRGHLLTFYAYAFLSGVLTAESPMGLVITLACWGFYILSVNGVQSGESPVLEPLVAQVSKWHLTFLFLIGVLVTIVVDCRVFFVLGIHTATGPEISELALAYIRAYWDVLASGATGVGWTLGLTLVTIPFLMCAVMLPRAVDEDHFMPYHVGAVFCLFGILSVAQLSGFPILWFWEWKGGEAVVNSPFLLAYFSLLSAITVAFALVVFGVNAFCRDHARLEQRLIVGPGVDIEPGDDTEYETGNEEAVTKVVSSPVLTGILRMSGVIALPVILLLVSVPQRRLEQVRALVQLINDFVRETVSECGSARYVFTDGYFDAALEIESAIQGKKLCMLPLVSEDENVQVVPSLKEGMKGDAESVLAFKEGGNTALLRSWMHDLPAQLTNCAFQVGFEAWTERAMDLPFSVSGVLARPFPKEEEKACTAGVEASRKLADRVLAFYKDERPNVGCGFLVSRLFEMVQWRLARLARLRGTYADQKGDVARALIETKLADALDNRNASFKELVEALEQTRRLVLRKTSPREGLQLALARADFSLAHRYAETILLTDPEEPNANFGMGMSYFEQRKWSLAETYLRRCLVRNPDDPAVYNNLAIALQARGKLDAAEKCVRKALTLAPNSFVILDTQRGIAQARKMLQERNAIKVKP